jgi:acyl-CoA thioester hydrolase
LRDNPVAAGQTFNQGVNRSAQYNHQPKARILISTADNKPNDAFRWPVRVYYEDTDAAGIVYYANYLKFLERARTEWLRAAGYEQNELRDEHGIAFVVRALALEYVAPALFNEMLEVSVGVGSARASVLDLVQAVRRDGQTLVTASVKIACINTRTFKPVRIPQPILEKLAAGSA